VFEPATDTQLASGTHVSVVVVTRWKTPQGSVSLL